MENENQKKYVVVRKNVLDLPKEDNEDGSVVLFNAKTMEKYYNPEKEAYVFKDGVIFGFDVRTTKNIVASVISGETIEANIVVCSGTIACENLEVDTVEAETIIVEENIKANSIKFEEVLKYGNTLNCNDIKCVGENGQIIEGDQIKNAN